MNTLHAMAAYFAGHPQAYDPYSREDLQKLVISLPEDAAAISAILREHVIKRAAHPDAILSGTASGHRQP